MKKFTESKHKASSFWSTWPDYSHPAALGHRRASKAGFPQSQRSFPRIRCSSSGNGLAHPYSNMLVIKSIFRCMYQREMNLHEKLWTASPVVNRRIQECVGWDQGIQRVAHYTSNCNSILYVKQHLNLYHVIYIWQIIHTLIHTLYSHTNTAAFISKIHKNSSFQGDGPWSISHLQIQPKTTAHSALLPNIIDNLPKNFSSLLLAFNIFLIYVILKHFPFCSSRASSILLLPETGFL